MRLEKLPPAQTTLSRYDPPPPAIATGPPPSDWHRYVTAVLRHRWLVLLIVGIGTAAGVVATRLLDPRYSARAVLWIETPARGGADRGWMMDDEVMESTGWTELVRSHAVLDSVVRGLRLFLGFESAADRLAFETFQLRGDGRAGRYRLTVSADGRRYALTELATDVVVDQGAVGDSIGRPLGFEWAPPASVLGPGRRIDFYITAPYDAVQRLANEVRVVFEPGSSFLRLELRGTDPVLAAATVNAIADGAARVAADLKRRKFEELASILGGQLAHAEAALRRAEASLRDFRVRTAGRAASHAATMAGVATSQNPALTQSLAMSVDLEQLGRDRRTIERLLASDSDTRGRSWIEALAVIGAVQASPALMRALEEATEKQAEIRALRYRYTDESAPVSKLRADLETLEQRSIPALARALTGELASRETSLRSRADSASAELRRVPVIAIDEARLARDLANTEELHHTVRQRYEAARLSLVSSLPDVRVLDAALPPGRPLSDYGPLVIVFAFLASLVLAVIVATVYDTLDPKVRYPEQVTDRMRLPILGAVPHVSWRAARSGDPSAGVIESLRGLRVRIANAVNGNGAKLLTVTSPGIGDGKSFLSLNLALSFAYAGFRTLLIDGDVRRGVQHRVLGLARKPGLTDVLARRLPPEGAVRDTPFDNLWFMGCGTRMQRAPELLLGPDLPELVARLRTAYDVVVVDSPPLAAGADPLVLGGATGNLLLVLRCGATDLALTMSKLDELDALPVRTIGAVLNDVRGGDAFRYYTYESAGYGLPDEELAGSDSPEPYQILGGRS